MWPLPWLPDNDISGKWFHTGPPVLLCQVTNIALMWVPRPDTIWGAIAPCPYPGVSLSMGLAQPRAAVPGTKQWPFCPGEFSSVPLTGALGWFHVIGICWQPG